MRPENPCGAIPLNQPGVSGLFGASFSHPNFLREVGRSLCLALSFDDCRGADLLESQAGVFRFQTGKEAIPMTTIDIAEMRSVLKELSQRVENLGGHL